MTQDDTILTRLAHLSPREFENLVFDCARAIGIRNLIWRTPGPDGGRDIEGHVYTRDISGHEKIETWYVECKRYKKSIDWPTVWKKTSHADVLQADVFFLVTNSNPSPTCESRIQAWNTKRRTPAIRIWRGYDFPSFLRSKPSIAASYGLAPELASKQAQLISISDLILRITQSAYSACIFDHNPLTALETAAALSELLHHRLGDIQMYGRFVAGPKASLVPQYNWLQVNGRTHAWEDVSLRSLATLLHYFWQCDTVELRCDERTATFQPCGARTNIDLASDENLSEVLTWCRSEMLSFDKEAQQILLRQRS